MKQTIRDQALQMGYSVKGTLKRVKDDVFYNNQRKVRNRVYIDESGVELEINRLGKVVMIVGEDWVI